MSGNKDREETYPHRIVIIGGHSGGNGFMSQARRFTEKTEIILLEKGPYLGSVKCGLTHHLAGTVPNRETLVSTDPAVLANRFKSDIRLRQEVLSIDRARKTLSVRDLESDVAYELSYDKLVLATGTTPVIPARLPGIELPGVRYLHTVEDMDEIAGQLLDTPATHATVVGAGTIGLQVTEALRRRGLAVTVIERSSHVMRHIDKEMATLLQQAIRADGVQLLLDTIPLEFFAEGNRLRVRPDKGSEFVTDMVILATGIRPNSAMAQAAGLATGADGSVCVDNFMRTSDPDIYAVGDLIETPSIITGKPISVQISVPIARQTRVAAAHMFGRPVPYRGAIGSFAWQFFGQAVASTGANEQQLNEAQRPFTRVFIPSTNHVTFFPGATPLFLKLLYCPENGKILGAQAIGNGADKRIDVLATAIAGNLTVHDLEYLELCYSPHFGSPIDAINQAGSMASGIMRGSKQVIQPEMVRGDSADLVLDVRSEDEFNLNAIPGSLNIPLEQLRTRLGELPRDKRIVICCQIGSKAHTIQRTLTHHGFDAVTLMGGYTAWKLWHGVEDAVSRLETKHDATRDNLFIEDRRRNPSLRSDHERRKRHGQLQDSGQERRHMNQRSNANRRQAWQGVNLDARGMVCPGPILSLRKKIAELPHGTTIQITASDPAFPRDLAAWCNRTGNVLERVFVSSAGSVAYCSKKQAAA